MSERRGHQTTEFWLVACVAALGGLLCALAVLGREGLAWPGVALLVACVASYGHSRGKAKAPRPYLPPRGP